MAAICAQNVFRMARLASWLIFARKAGNHFRQMALFLDLSLYVP